MYKTLIKTTDDELTKLKKDKDKRAKNLLNFLKIEDKKEKKLLNQNLQN